MSTFSLDNIAPDVEALHPRLPWASLRPDEHPPALIAQARRFWSENAFAEWASALAMEDLSRALDQAPVPEALRSEARAFPDDERTHVALCAGVARRCGGGVALPYDPASLHAPRDPAHTPLEHATALVLRTACVGEAVAQPLLAGNLRAARQPLARAVLERIVRDETRHARFGWRYFEWAAPRLDADERRRLGELLGALLRPLTAGLDDERRSAGGDGGGLGWMSPSEWRTRARQAIDELLLARLARLGITPRDS